MIQNNKELKTSQERIAYFQNLLLQLRTQAMPEEFPFVSSGYRMEIEKMQAEVLDYLTRHISEKTRTMSINTIEKDFIDKVSAEIRLSSDGTNRFRVFTPFRFDDGDHLAIVLKKEGERWLLSDGGHTYMHLTYDIDEKLLNTGTRKKIISRALSLFDVEDRDGELIREVSNGNYGKALYAFAQALLRIADVSYLSRKRVQSTFTEDFRALLSENVSKSRMRFDWSDPERDPEKNYIVDCRVNGGVSRFLCLHLTVIIKPAMLRLPCINSRSGGSRSVLWVSSKIKGLSVAKCKNVSAMCAIKRSTVSS